jgi:hypothetical protein
MLDVPAKTKMESNKRREGMYNIIDFQLMGGLSEQWKIGLSCKTFCINNALQVCVEALQWASVYKGVNYLVVTRSYE